MKIGKICVEILKKYFRAKTDPDEKFVIGELNGDILVTLDGFHGWIIPESAFPFDTEKLLNGEKTLGRTEILFSDDDYTDGELTEDIALTEDGRNVAVKITDGQGTEVWVMKKHLEFFDEGKVHFKVKNMHKPVHVYEGDRLSGFILPSKTA